MGYTSVPRDTSCSMAASLCLARCSTWSSRADGVPSAGPAVSHHPPCPDAAIMYIVYIVCSTARFAPLRRTGVERGVGN